MTDPVAPTQTGGTVPPQAGGTTPPPASPPAAPAFPPALSPAGQEPAGQEPVAPSAPSAPSPGATDEGATSQGATGENRAGDQPVAFPPAGPAQPAAEPKKSGVKKKVLSVLGAILIFVIIAGIKSGLGSLLAKDPTGDAKAGSCIALKSKLTESATEVDAETADCASADAKYSVLARVDGVSDVNGTACDPTFEAKLKEGQEGYVIGSTEDDGYLLCLTLKA